MNEDIMNMARELNELYKDLEETKNGINTNSTKRA